ncbi:MAG: hypothetical protein V2A69_05740 [Pseudomonadota bacterium]
MKDILDRISPNEALEILRQLAKNDKEIEERISKIAEDIIRDVDVEAICEDVFFALDGIDVHELWDRSGSTSYGYVSPEDMAVEMMEEEIDPFNQEVFRLIELNMPEEAKLSCMGVLKGIYKYSHESKSEFKDWAVDVPGECFSNLLAEWKKRCKNKASISEMNDFLQKECGSWAK